MTVSDERLYQLAYDPMMCNISEEVQECLRELVERMKMFDNLMTEIKLPPEQFQEFLDAVDNPTEPSPALHRLLTEPSVIEKSNALQENDNTVVWNKGWKATEKGLVNNKWQG